MSKVRIGVRVLFGVAFLFFGVAGLLQLFKPPPMEGAQAAFMAGMVAVKYLFPLMSIVEVVSGLLLVSGRAVPFALTLLAPILINILGYHLALDLKGIGAGAVLTVLEVFLAWSYRDAFRPLFTAKPTA